jgi:hypothetical protein
MGPIMEESGTPLNDIPEIWPLEDFAIPWKLLAAPFFKKIIRFQEALTQKSRKVTILS